MQSSNGTPGDREQQLIELVAQGHTNRKIAQALGISEYAVKNDLRIIYNKFGFWNRVELALWYEARRSEGEARLEARGAV